MSVEDVLDEGHIKALYLEHLVNQWLLLGGVRVRFSWDPGGQSLSLSGGGLFGAIALNLAFAASRSTGLAFCSGCSDLYEPRRMPRMGESHYCDDCRKRGVDAAARQRRRRETRGVTRRGAGHA